MIKNNTYAEIFAIKFWYEISFVLLMYIWGFWRILYDINVLQSLVQNCLNNFKQYKWGLVILRILPNTELLKAFKGLLILITLCQTWGTDIVQFYREKAT